jgi:hypothetical protein
MVKFVYSFDEKIYSVNKFMYANLYGKLIKCKFF